MALMLSSLRQGGDEARWTWSLWGGIFTFTVNGAFIHHVVLVYSDLLLFSNNNLQLLNSAYVKPAAIYQPHTKQLYFLIMLLQVLNAIVKKNMLTNWWNSKRSREGYIFITHAWKSNEEYVPVFEKCKLVWTTWLRFWWRQMLCLHLCI